MAIKVRDDGPDGALIYAWFVFVACVSVLTALACDRRPPTLDATPVPVKPVKPFVTRARGRLASAITVPVNAGGVVSITAVPPQYIDRYVVQKSDFGFFWLDTEARQAGYVQVEAHSGTGQPQPKTNIYVVGDCNGITNVSASGQIVLGRQFSGQCGAAMQNGERVDGTGMFAFGLGTWEYQGRTEVDISDSTQPTDLAGWTWRLRSTGDNRNFYWEVVAQGGTPVPTAVVSATAVPTAAPTVPPPPTATCSDAGFPYGKPGPMGRCYGCAGDLRGVVLPDGTCGPLGAVTPTPPPVPTITHGPDDLLHLAVGGSRFSLRVSWGPTGAGDSGVGQPVVMTTDTGYFWFFSSNNVELVVKVVDGRPVNGKWWVFWGALTDVAWKLDVRDSATGTSKTYAGEAGAQRSGNDTSAFGDPPGKGRFIASRGAVLPRSPIEGQQFFNEADRSLWVYVGADGGWQRQLQMPMPNPTSAHPNSAEQGRLIAAGVALILIAVVFLVWQRRRS